MSETISSEDAFDMDDVSFDSELDFQEGSSSKKNSSSVDSRRRLEDRLAERQLQKDIQEFNFDI